MLSQISKNQLSRPKKKVKMGKIFEFFENPHPPPFEKILDPSLKEVPFLSAGVRRVVLISVFVNGEKVSSENVSYYLLLLKC